ncbi:MAG: branched-chain alpha-keto acid dehydrogenase subunit E2 [Acidobacteria bacterium]|jgi:pyruvate dehydrogenase E2 component (dihydrolipoamide acetyltransferase)|nr:branched-chain alpha-keto acid dehydrogenase subunit E2 [Acidobacteriota bacterium]MDP7337830.1 dihydrolipoamide acetyltransferase family protein [Vicinamibacterales bacterium]MDP7480594.1 dihydrolipoamide acetyltransferase family protein [Vicinamibacterales bacterium]MDP7690509.1 dihydrolipoamide acetyltransferase family protein [Vicinamibacterales bacterium]HJN42905.1 dihydrolipoamide acetyltransferase family protein [Vicinamibacterales bacterium]|tara:strand:+ start:1222 stop:2316 length:1095 start_codon:yes stop_codon:yes gene_type:complete
MSTFLLPDLGEGLAGAEIVSWHVAVGDHVVTDQPLVAVETDKAVVEIPSPQSGRVTRLCADVGAPMQVGDPLVEFEAAGSQADTGTVVGDVETGSATAMPAPVAARSAVKATPSVRALARKRGIDITVLQGTGPGGAVTAKDVERGADTLADAGPAEPLRGVRRAMADRMAKAHAEVVPAGVTDVADVEAWSEETVVMLRLIRAVVAGCTTTPALNAWFNGAERSRRLRKTVDLGIAVDVDDGLFVPVLRDVGHRTMDDLLEALERLKRDVRARTIPPDELRGQSITLSNFGTVGGQHAQLVVVPPQVAIVGVGRMRRQVVAVGDAPAIRRQLPLSLTFDHRAVTGAEAARFLQALIADLERAE